VKPPLEHYHSPQKAHLSLTLCIELKGGERQVNSLTPVAVGVLENDGAKKGKEVEGGSNVSSRSVKGASSTTLDSRGREDS